MQIGGVNLASDTEDIVIDGGRPLYYSCKRGDIYTVSIESSEVQLSGLGTQMMVYSATDGAAAYIPISTDKQAQTFTWNSDDRIMRLCASENWTGKTRVKKLKLEKGNKSTDWSPAPEDIKKEAVDDITNSFSINENKISLGAKRIIMNGTTLAKAISAGELEVGDPKNPALKITKEGAFYAKGVTQDSSFLIDSDELSIVAESRVKSNYPESGDGRVHQIMRMEAKIGKFVIINDDGERAEISSNGIIATQAGKSPFQGQSSMLASIVGLGCGRIEDEGYGDRKGVIGVYGSAENIALNPVPAYGGYFEMLRANGLCLNTRAIDGNAEISDRDVIISCYNESPCTVTLPSAPYKGRIIYVRMAKSKSVTVVSSSANILVQGKKQTAVFVGKIAGDGAMLIWDEKSWLYNYIQT